MSNARYVRCRACRALASGSATRCPACSASLAPPEPTVRRRFPVANTLGAIALAGLTLLVGLLALPFLAVIGLAQLFRRRWVRLLGTAALALLAVSQPALDAALDYSAGTAMFRDFGLFQHESGSRNLDPRYRCGRTSLGCIRDPISATYADIYDGALRWMIDSFGPMEGAYTGTYPGSSESLEILARDGRTVPFESFGEEGILEVLPEIDHPLGRSSARVARVDGCLLVGIESGDERGFESITLVDARTRRWFACYHWPFVDR